MTVLVTLYTIVLNCDFPLASVVLPPGTDDARIELKIAI